MKSFLFPLKPRILDIGIIIREKKYRKLQCRTNERKTPIFNCKTTVVNNAELSSLSGYWSGVPCKNANFACNVISEAGSLAVEKQWFHWLSGWNVVLIAYLWLFLLFFLDEIHFIWLFFFQKAEKLSSANRIQWRVLSRSLQLYFILFEHEATISTPWFFYQIFFIRLWNVARKIMVSNTGLHIFSAAFYTKKCEKMSRLVL